MDDSAPWKAEETIVSWPRLLVLSVPSRSDSPDLVAVTFCLTCVFRSRRRPRSGRRLKLVAPSGRLSSSESVSGIAVKRKGECKHQQPRISCTNCWCNRLSNRPGMIHFLATRFSGTKRVAGSTWITRRAWWWCAALLRVRKRPWIWVRRRSCRVPSWSLRSTPTRTRVPRDGNPVPARPTRNRPGFSVYHASSAPMTAFIQRDLLHAGAG